MCARHDRAHAMRPYAPLNTNARRRCCMRRYLKVVVSVGAVKATAGHAAALETGDRNRTDTSPCDRASLQVLYGHEQYVVHALPVTQTGTRVFACWTIQKEWNCDFLFDIVLSSRMWGGKDHYIN